MPLPRKLSSPPIPAMSNETPFEQEQLLPPGMAEYETTIQQPEENRYPALRILSKFFMGYAVITVLITVGWILETLVDGFPVKQEKDIGIVLITVLAVLFSGLFSVLVLCSISELIKVFLDIEKNTRKL